MESSPTFHYVTHPHTDTIRWSSIAPHHIVPPTSKRVLAELAERLSTNAEFGIRQAERMGPDREKLWAYKECAKIIRHHSRTFYFSARLLPARKRLGIVALYAFCRTSDDLVDNADAQEGREEARAAARAALDDWSRLASAPLTRSDHPVLVAWADTRHRYGIPAGLAEELLHGIRMDLTTTRFETWDDLWVYCYRVASTVGLMSLFITGAETMAAVPYAVQLGVALQLTNILRDIGEDAMSGRIYVPAEDMARFGYTEEHLLRGEVNRNFISLMRFEIARARALYGTAWDGIAMLPADSRLAVIAAAKVYGGILDKIEAARYNVFTHRAHLTMGEKVRALPSLWWAARRMKPPGRKGPPGVAQ